MLVGRPSFTFWSQRTVFDSKRFVSFAGDVVLPFLQQNKNISFKKRPSWLLLLLSAESCQ